VFEELAASRFVDQRLKTASSGPPATPPISCKRNRYLRHK
ncbi:uncharacterized protein METZ01_LOCUS400005, partial [marine metagenome]